MPEHIVVMEKLTGYTYHAGTRSSPPLVFLHGWGASKEVWSPAANHYAKAGFSVYTLDMPGFGETSHPNDTWGVGDYAAFIKKFLEKLSVPKVILIGHSFGGRVGLVLAAQEPALVSKLVLVDSAGFYTKPFFKKIMSYGAKLVRPLFRFRFTNPLRSKIYRTIGASDYVDTPELKATFVRVIGEDLTSLLPRIEQETLIVWGEKDVATPVSYAYRFHKHIRDSKVSVIPNAGHYSFLDQPEKFYTILDQFLN